MKNLNRISLCASLLLLAACGSQSLQDTGGLVSASSSAAATNTGSTAAGVGNVSNLPAAYQNRVQLGGNNSSNFTQTINGLKTSHTLKVKVTPLTAANLTVINSSGNYTNFNFQYGCLAVSVTVNGSTQTTIPLQVAGVAQSPICKTAATYQVLDFSSVMTGDGPVTVSFSNAQYDNCSRFGSPYPAQYGCSMAAVWMNHQVALEATVQVDGTWMDP